MKRFIRILIQEKDPLVQAALYHRSGSELATHATVTGDLATVLVTIREWMQREGWNQ